MPEPRRDVLDVLSAIYSLGLEAATTAELREVVAWLSGEIDERPLTLVGRPTAPDPSRAPSGE